ncbi:MAG TPA: universal stress protein, partial [Thermoplasmatales archaeon]|nr:universal stress protein [Thermoplasmatales archaeon]
MFRKILYPTDFSKDAEKALEYVKKLKETGTEEVVILHVIDGESLEAMVTPCIWEGKDIEKCEEQIKRK